MLLFHSWVARVVVAASVSFNLAAYLGLRSWVRFCAIRFLSVRLNKQLCNLFIVYATQTWRLCPLAPAPNRLSDYEIWLFFDSLLSTRWLNFDFPAARFSAPAFSSAASFQFSFCVRRVFSNLITGKSGWGTTGRQAQMKSTRIFLFMSYFIAISCPPNISTVHAFGMSAAGVATVQWYVAPIVRNYFWLFSEHCSATVHSSAATFFCQCFRCQIRFAAEVCSANSALSSTQTSNYLNFWITIYRFDSLESGREWISMSAQVVTPILYGHAVVYLEYFTVPTRRFL